jgi:N-acetylglucosaminyldiphosphoundecaprenol N-acetyl-beta-D-mannosaminyltransferase
MRVFSVNLTMQIRDISGPLNSRKILNVSFNLISYDDVLQIIHTWLEKRERHYVALTNPLGVLTSQKDKLFDEALQKASLTLPDGVGIIFAATYLGYRHSGRVTGPDLTVRLCYSGQAYGYSHFFYGGNLGVPELLAGNLRQRFPGLRVAGTFSPPFRPLLPEEDARIIDLINRAQPDILWVGLGAPKQEKWMATHQERLRIPVMIGVGAAFNFHAGRVRRAPDWVRRIGFEWLWRQCSEESRPWRYPLTIPEFLYRVARQRFRLSHQD